MARSPVKTPRRRHPRCARARVELIEGALQLAITERARIVATMWREPEDTGPARLVSGTPYEFSSRSDGRERVHLRVAEGAEQILLVERIMRVMPDGG